MTEQVHDAAIHAVAPSEIVRIVAVSGGLGSPSSTRLLADRIIEHAERSLAALGVVAEFDVIELRGLAVDIANNLVTGFAPPALAEALGKLRAANGIIAVTPVFNGSMAGLFKSFFDLVEPDELRGIPVVLGATGGSVRHSLVTEFAMRPLFAYLRTLPLPTGIFVATEEWGSGSASIDERAAQVARELTGALRFSSAPNEGVRAVAAAERELAQSDPHDDFASLMAEYSGDTTFSATR